MPLRCKIRVSVVMSRNPQSSRPPLGAWNAESLRVTAFPTPDAVITPDTWWKDVIGADAATETFRKGKLVREDQGEALGGLLKLTVQPGRINWSLNAKPPSTIPEVLPHIAPYAELVPRLLDLMLRWVPASPPLARLAFGVAALAPVNSQEEAYHVLDALLPAVEVDPRSSDLAYSVNRPRDSGLRIEGLRINRLSQWRAVRMEYLGLPGLQPVSLPSVFAVRCDLDINTIPAFAGPLANVPDLLRELADLATEILVLGDCP